MKANLKKQYYVSPEAMIVLVGGLPVMQDTVMVPYSDTPIDQDDINAKRGNMEEEIQEPTYRNYTLWE